MIPNVGVVVELNGAIGLVPGCCFLLIIWALRQVGCETVGHLVTNASCITNVYNGCIA